MITDAPCKDCPDREVTEDFNCHMVCEKYIEFQKYRNEVNEKKAKENRLNWLDHKRIVQGR